MCFFVFLRAVVSAVGLTVLLNTCFMCYFILFTACTILCSQINDDDDDDDNETKRRQSKVVTAGRTCGFTVAPSS